jgi:ubiquinone/menaquinone biosynthesis C-methylase UbiE
VAEGTHVAHPVFARCYARRAAAMEEHGAAGIRERLLAGVAGRVLEVGAGTGANFGHYPATVTDVLAVEPEPHLRRLAERAAARAPVPVVVVDGDAAGLPAGDGAVDAVVCSLVLCSVPDQAAALREVHRVLRSGGTLHLWEHVRAEGRVAAGVQAALDRTVWPWLAGGCHTARDTVGALGVAGFEVTDLDRFRFPDIWLTQPTTPQVLGTAVRR